MQASTLFREGQLAAAVAACQQHLRQQPDDLTARTLLFELLAFQGQWQRAAKQLEVLGQQDVESEWAVQVYQNLLVAEQQRQSWWQQPSGTPGFLLDPPEAIQQHCEAVRQFAQGAAQQAVAVAGEAHSLLPTQHGSWKEQPFTDFRDVDDLLAPVIELFILRDYVWVPVAQLRQLEVAPPERPRDLIWAPARIMLDDGVQRRGYIPTRYVQSHQASDEAIQLGRLTDWLEHPGGLVTGLGLKTFLVGDDVASVLELGEIELAGGGDG